MRRALYRMNGVDQATTDAVGVETVQVVLTEYGPDLAVSRQRSTSSRKSP
jgi:hypothetical protein